MLFSTTYSAVMTQFNVLKQQKNFKNDSVIQAAWKPREKSSMEFAKLFQTSVFHKECLEPLFLEVVYSKKCFHLCRVSPANKLQRDELLC